MFLSRTPGASVPVFHSLRAGAFGSGVPLPSNTADVCRGLRPRYPPLPLKTGLVYRGLWPRLFLFPVTGAFGSGFSLSRDQSGSGPGPLVVTAKLGSLS